jgi:hypothetical protein
MSVDSALGSDALVVPGEAEADVASATPPATPSTCTLARPQAEVSYGSGAPTCLLHTRWYRSRLPCVPHLVWLHHPPPALCFTPGVVASPPPASCFTPVLLHRPHCLVFRTQCCCIVPTCISELTCNGILTYSPALCFPFQGGSAEHLQHMSPEQLQHMSPESPAISKINQSIIRRLQARLNPRLRRAETEYDFAAPRVSCCSPRFSLR